jgi:hypothetical protein
MPRPTVTTIVRVIIGARSKAAERDAKVLQQILEHHASWTDDGDGG